MLRKDAFYGNWSLFGNNRRDGSDRLELGGVKMKVVVLGRTEIEKRENIK